MIKISKPEKELTKVFIAVVIAVSLCICAWIFLNNQTAQLTLGYTNGIAKDNEYIVEAMAADITARASSEDQAVEIVKSAPSSGSRYWFLLSSESLIFERDAATTATMGRLSYSKLEDYYIRAGGRNIAELFDLINAGKNFSAVVVKDSTFGSELISVKFIDVGTEKLCVGTGVSQSFMLSSAKVGERIITLKIMTLLMCAALIAVTAFYSLANRKKALAISVLQNDLTDKNILVQGHGERLAAIESDSFEKSDDSLTGLYNKMFFESIMTKLSERKTEKVGIIYIRFSNLMVLNYEKGFAFTNQLLTDASKIFKAYATDKDIISHINKNEFVMLKFNSTSDQTLLTAQKLYAEIKGMNPNTIIAAGCSFKNQDKTIQQTLDAAFVTADWAI